MNKRILTFVIALLALKTEIQADPFAGSGSIDAVKTATSNDLHVGLLIVGGTLVATVFGGVVFMSATDPTSFFSHCFFCHLECEDYWCCEPNCTSCGHCH